MLKKKPTLCLKWLVLILACGCHPGFASTTGGLDNLHSRFQTEIASPGTVITNQILSQLREKHIVFVDGIANELASMAGNYYTDNIDAVKALGISYSHLSLWSGTPIVENADILYDDLRRIYEKNRRPIILVGHSKGGVESLLAVLNFPKLLARGWVEKVVLIQAAIGGSELVEKIQPYYYFGAMEFFYGPGLQSLRPIEALKTNEQAFSNFLSYLRRESIGREIQLMEDKMRWFSDRIYYVRGAHNDNETLSLGLKTVLFLCKEPLDYFTKHDGILRIADQIFLPSAHFGVDLGILDADHIELVVSGIFSRSNARTRQAFTRALLSQIYSD